MRIAGWMTSDDAKGTIRGGVVPFRVLGKEFGVISR
jgi:hypothetical protein